jgi:hypothetical protein
MAWEKRGNQSYYYRSVRVGKQVKKVYYGSGPAAALAARSADLARANRTAGREAERQRREEYAVVTSSAHRLMVEVDELMKAELSVAGYYCHRGEWRRRGSQQMEEQTMSTETTTTDKTNKSTVSNTVDLKALVDLADKGDAVARVRLREVLDASPEIWRKVGDLAGHARLALIRMIANGDQLLLESVQRHAEEMEAELLGANPTRLERMLVERVVAAWLQLQFTDTVSTSYDETLGQAKFWSQERDRAHRRYLSSVKALVTTRLLLLTDSESSGSTTDCNKNGKQVADAVQHGDHSDVDTDANGDNGSSTLPERKPVNGHGTLRNGHPVNRILPFAGSTTSANTAD